MKTQLFLSSLDDYHTSIIATDITINIKETNKSFELSVWATNKQTKKHPDYCQMSVIFV
jgi:hypothetical protein